MRTWLSLTLLLFAAPSWARISLDLETGETENAAVQWTLAGSLAGQAQISFSDTSFFYHGVVRWFEFNLEVSDRHLRITPMTSTQDYDPLVQHAQDYAAEVNSAFFSVKGLIEKTDFREETWSWAAGVRLWGLTARSTSLTASYRYGFAHESNFYERFQSTERSLGAFIEYQNWRLFGRFGEENETRSPWGDDVLREVRRLTDLGLRVSF